jgi:5-methylcytosine-specific restriction protein A
MASGDDWSNDELQASVNAYLEMLRLHRSGKPYVKKQYYRALAQRYRRTEKAFEYRAQNISYVLALQGREWLPGLVPAKNVGAKIAAQIEQLLADAEGTPNPRSAAFESQVVAARKRPESPVPVGNNAPTAEARQAQVYDRDPAVKAWVLATAKGTCESCKQAAPFLTVDNEPFLEVHHVRHLADGGSDTTTNAVAVCPNCHRALHYSADRQKLVAALFERLTRLIKE